MRYAEFPPHPTLSKIIECYWSALGTAAPGNHTVYPDGCMDILYDFSETPFSSDEDRAFVVGNMTRPIHTYSSGHTDILGIRFKPAGISLLLKTPLVEFNDLSVSLKNLIQFPDHLSVQSLSEKTLHERIHLFDHFFLTKFINRFFNSSQWNYCLDMILQTKGNVSIRNVSLESGISQKHLERKFKENVGLTPKQLSLVLRFRELKNQLEKKQGDLLQLAIDLNYSDHAHLTKSFKALAGITPTEYLRSVS